MPDTDLIELLERNNRHTDSIAPDHFEDVEGSQRPAVVSICCSDSRVSQEGMWDVDSPGWIFTPSTIGNQVWDVHDGELVVDGSLLYPMVQTDTAVTAVVGHTGCGAITAAYESVTETASELPPGIEKWVELLVPVVEDALDAGIGDVEDESLLIDQLVEYNVDRQVEFLRDRPEIPAGEEIYGFVYDLHRRYGDVPGRTYLLNRDGETDPERIRATIPDRFDGFVRRLTPP